MKTTTKPIKKILTEAEKKVLKNKIASKESILLGKKNVNK
jgi:hypothetical protein